MLETDQPMIDSRGHRRTASLFLETTQDSQLGPVYTLRDYPAGELPSAYQIYMSSVDEYDAAMRLVGSLYHWKKLLKCKWFVHGDAEGGFSGLEEWRKDLEMRDSSRAKRLAQEHLAAGDLKAASLMLDIAAGKKTRQLPKTKANAKTTPRRGTQNSTGVVDIGHLASRIKPE